MAIPVSERDVELPLLHEIELAGGEVKSSPELFDEVAKYFPQLSPADKVARYLSGRNKWEMRVGWARTKLKREGELDDSSPRGIWRITERGKERLKREWIAPPILEVKSATEATEIALSFLKEHYQFIPQQPIKAAKEDTVWLVEIDVGLLHTRIAKIKVDAKTAAILEYSIPPEEI